MPSLNRQMKITSIDSSFSDNGIVGAMRSCPPSAALTQQVSRVMYRQGQFLKEFSKSQYGQLQQVELPDGATQWGWGRQIDGIDHRVSFTNAGVIGSVSFREVENDTQIDEMARRYGVSSGETYVTIDGKRYFVHMSIPLCFHAPEGNEAVVNLAVFVLGTEGIGASIAAIASGAGIAAFGEVLSGLNSGLFTVLWTAVSGAVQVAYTFVAAFVGQIIGGAEIGAALGAAQAASGELIAGGVFSAITGAALAYTLVGLLIVALIYLIIEYVLHYSYQNVYVYNLTDKELEFDFGYVYEGNPHNLSAKTVPPLSTRVGAGGAPLGTWYNGTAFRFQSDSEFYGIGFAMVAKLFDPATRTQVASFTCMFDTPFVGDNSLNVVSGIPGSVQDFYSDSEGEHKTTQMSAKGEGYEMLVTFDYLSGTHRDPETGDDEYLYNSLIVVRPAGG